MIWKVIPLLRPVLSNQAGKRKLFHQWMPDVMRHLRLKSVFANGKEKLLMNRPTIRLLYNSRLHSISTSRDHEILNRRNTELKTWCHLWPGRSRTEVPIIESVKSVRDEESSDIDWALNVTWRNGDKSSFPFVYLRDCCQCKQCFHLTAQQRLVDITSLMDMAISPLIKHKKIEFSEQNQSVKIVWDDGHESSFENKWLWERKLPNASSKEESNVGKILWGSEMSGKLPQVTFTEFMKSDRHLYFYLNCLIRIGFVILTNAPEEPGVLHQVANRLQTHIRKTHYGEIFSVKSKNDPNNIAYTSGKIPLHTDLSYYKYQPGTQHLHCIEQAANKEEGGTLLVDGFYIADRLRKNNPEDFENLTKINFIFKDIGEDIYGKFKKELSRPIVELDENGDPIHVAFNNFTRSSFFNVPARDVEKVYRAYSCWEKELLDPSNVLRFKLSPGDILSFDNIRLLHGREAYDTTVSPRWLEGCYIDWDEIYSAFAVTNDRLEANLLSEG